MGKIIFLALIIGAVAWVYFNGDLETFKFNAINKFQNEKTIKKFQNADREKNNQLNETLKENF